MPHTRPILLSFAILLVGGSLAWTTGYAIHLRSEDYRKEVEVDLSNFFELPSEVGRIRGRTFSSRSFHDVAIWLPDRRDQVFGCKEAVWHEVETAGGEHHELDLRDGVLALGSDRWVKEDFRQVLESGLGHNFEDLNLTRVGLAGFEVSFRKRDFAIRCRQTSGEIDVSDPANGIARLHAYELNGHPIAQGVQIYARFLPKNGVQVHEVQLSLPTVPLETIGLDSLLGGQVTHGRFSGSVQFLQNASDPEVWVRGQLEDAELGELTRTIALGPLSGRISVNVDGARIARSVVTHLRGSGRIKKLSLASFAPLVSTGELAGTASFDIDVVDLAMGHVNRLRFGGVVEGLSLESILAPWGRGSATGRLSVRVNNIEIVDDHIKSADIEVSAVPPAGGQGTIDRALMLSAVEKAFHFAWPESLPQNLLPEKVEYAEFGLRLLVRDDQLRILGTHGDDGNTILTIRIAGMTFGVVKSRPGHIDLGPYLTEMLERARAYDPERVRDWWRRHHDAIRPPGPTSSAPDR
ncbi:MAG TPA: hypothetical protein VJZ71_00490 [Phycisphaerae bacterium]|nr:hypothetical protein [Phycisphaerae bacterium]